MYMTIRRETCWSRCRVPTVSGYTSQIQNVGATQNKGLEVQAGATILQHKAFRWTGSFNISFNQNKIVSLGNQQTNYLANSGWAGSGNPADFIVEKGQPVGAMYGYVSDGYYTTNDFNYNAQTRVYTLKPGEPNDANVTASTPMPGSIKYRGLNGDTTISANDRTIIGSAQPKFFGGFSQQFCITRISIAASLSTFSTATRSTTTTSWSSPAAIRRARICLGSTRTVGTRSTGTGILSSRS